MTNLIVKRGRGGQEGGREKKSHEEFYWVLGREKLKVQVTRKNSGW